MPGRMQDSKPQDLNQLRKVRREKLQTLIDAGENPYEIVTYDQSEHSRQIKEHYADYENQEVSIAGRRSMSPATTWETRRTRNSSTWMSATLSA